MCYVCVMHVVKRNSDTAQLSLQHVCVGIYDASAYTQLPGKLGILTYMHEHQTILSVIVLTFVSTLSHIIPELLGELREQ